MKKIFYLTTLICLSFCLNSNAQTTLNAGLAAYYPFNGNDSDISPNHNNPFINSATLTNDRFGNANSAYYFDGSTSYMQVSNNSTINFNNQMSLCVWMKPTGYYTGRCYNNMLISKAVTDAPCCNTGNYSMRFADYVNGCNALADTTKEYLFGPDGGVCLNQKIFTNRWYFVVFTTDGTTCKTYINNKLSHIGSHPSGMTFTNSYDLMIGAFGDSMQYPYFFKGALDDIRIYNRALSDTEVSDLYNYADFPTVSGNVFVDLNGNGIYDSSDFYKPNQRIDASNGNFSLTNSKGNYDMVFDTLGIFQTQIFPTGLYTSNPGMYTYTFNSYKDTVINSDYVLTNTIGNFDSVNIKMIPLYNAARPGFIYPVGISYYNNGNTVLNNTSLVVNYDSSKLQYISSSDPNVVDNGLTLSLPVFNFAAGDQLGFNAIFKVKTTANLGDTLKQLVTIANTNISASDSFYSVIRGSYDPNEKDATPTLTPLQVNQGKFIDYIIRFENTGTDTAFKVVVTDELSNLLVKNTIQITAQSHNVHTSVEGRKAIFTFDDIKLPPTSINPLASHGYVAFKLRPIPNLTNGTNIPNTANIYFDYNVPIVTNTAITKIQNPIITPVKFTNYELKLINETNKKVSNIWNTNNEINVAYYNVQRSFDGIEFKTIGTTKANNKATNEYKFIDENLPANNNKNYVVYYRINAIDNDGKESYSVIKALSIINYQLSINIYPNPTKDVLNIEGKNIKQATIKDVVGRTITQFNISSINKQINVSTLSKGIYIIEFDNGEKTKFIKE